MLSPSFLSPAPRPPVVAAAAAAARRSPFPVMKTTAKGAMTAKIASTTTSDKNDHSDIDWTSRLCWVHRRAVDDEGATSTSTSTNITSSTTTTSSNKKRSYLWPAVYYHGWEEATYYCTRDMTPQQKVDLALRMYASSTADASASAASGQEEEKDVVVVVARLLGTMELMEIPIPAATNKENNTKDDEDDEDSLFCGDFFGWAPHAMITCSQPQVFQDHMEWYLPFMKAIDEAFAMPRTTTSTTTSTVKSSCHKMFQLGQQRLAAYSQEQKNAAGTASSPSSSSKEDDAAESSSTEEEEEPSTPDEQAVVDANTTNEYSTVSPSTSSSQDTPTRSNKEKRGLRFSPDNTTAKKSIKSAPTKKSRNTTKPKPKAVTPSRNSVRPKRKAAQKTDALTPTSPLTKSSSSEDDENFYSFNNLKLLIVDKLGWTYRKASNTLQTWVYERVDTDGEQRGVFLEDYFYEEDEVIEYCRVNDYKERFGHLWEEEAHDETDGSSDQTAEETSKAARTKQCFISPSPHKRARRTVQ
jgi:hypothetical protein